MEEDNFLFSSTMVTLTDETGMVNHSRHLSVVKQSCLARTPLHHAGLWLSFHSWPLQQLICNVIIYVTWMAPAKSPELDYKSKIIIPNWWEEPRRGPWRGSGNLRVFWPYNLSLKGQRQFLKRFFVYFVYITQAPIKRWSKNESFSWRCGKEPNYFFVEKKYLVNCLHMNQ